MTRFIAIGFILLGFLFSAGTNNILYEGVLHETSHVPHKTTSIIYHSVDGGRTWMPFDSGIPSDATVSSWNLFD